ncbi:hypothetical protein SELMODRAFT_140962 [Selaginella moellendorffii]|uniref:Asymmetric leaves 1 n=1 Tax=Selaginella moellendorffii TaxID=88036 RepID=D8QT95_SELML|nr:transcription factor AS1 [Selaginella moellendorffii]EFJ37575.1 hypothetical protein SELMODRAFT_140962 [Selaginella moellendorffii]QOQ51801.1 asymmetric leaves 1 [Selaginella moellendorffii]|eukprot:XP_002962315.1 transcription factor AS1 [Selaginella moellendorffii]
MSIATKDRQRWQPEEDAILCAYVTQYGADDWNLISERMGEPLDRDPKSCHERWKNYLKPGIKKGPLTDEEQQLVIKLQTKYGNKWKRIAAEVPGRTAKRLGKWWEVYKERLIKDKKKLLSTHAATGNCDSMVMEAMHLQALAPGFSRPFLSSTPDLCVNGAPAFSTSTPDANDICGPPTVCQDHFGNNASGVTTTEALSGDETLLTLGPSTTFQKQFPMEVVATSGVTMPKWIPKKLEIQIASTLTESSLSLSSSRTADEGLDCLDPASESSDNNEGSNLSMFELFKELREQRENWIQQKKGISSKLKELKQQLECEKAEKQRQKIQEVDARVKALKEEKKQFLQKVEQDYSELVSNLERDAEMKEKKLTEAWTLKYDKLVHTYERYTLSGPVFHAE